MKISFEKTLPKPYKLFLYFTKIYRSTKRPLNHKLFFLNFHKLTDMFISYTHLSRSNSQSFFTHPSLLYSTPPRQCTSTQHCTPIQTSPCHFELDSTSFHTILSTPHQPMSICTTSIHHSTQFHATSLLPSITLSITLHRPPSLHTDLHHSKAPFTSP